MIWIIAALSALNAATTSLVLKDWYSVLPEEDPSSPKFQNVPGEDLRIDRVKNIRTISWAITALALLKGWWDLSA